MSVANGLSRTLSKEATACCWFTKVYIHFKLFYDAVGQSGGSEDPMGEGEGAKSAPPLGI
jgi:hypothetical protein